MTKEEMKEYAVKYRKIQKRLSIGFAIFIFLISIVLVVAAVLICIYNKDSYILYVVSGIMVILAVVDTFVGIKLIKYSRVKFDRMSDKECAEHYCKIHGFNSNIEK